MVCKILSGGEREGRFGKGGGRKEGREGERRERHTWVLGGGGGTGSDAIFLNATSPSPEYHHSNSFRQNKKMEKAWLTNPRQVNRFTTNQTGSSYTLQSSLKVPENCTVATYHIFCLPHYIYSCWKCRYIISIHISYIVYIDKIIINNLFTGHPMQWRIITPFIH